MATPRATLEEPPSSPLQPSPPPFLSPVDYSGSPCPGRGGLQPRRGELGILDSEASLWSILPSRWRCGAGVLPAAGFLKAAKRGYRGGEPFLPALARMCFREREED